MDQLAPLKNATQAAQRFAASSAGQVARIEALVTVSCLLVVILVSSNSWRRHEASALPRLLAWGAYLFYYPLISYTIGLMQSSSLRNDLFVVWASFLLLLLGSADSMTAFCFHDQQETRSMMNQALHIVYLLFLILYYKDQLGARFKASLFLLWALSILRLGLRVKAYRLASRSRGLLRENQVVFDYMRHEPLSCAVLQNGEESACDPITMREYIYLVDGREEEMVEYGEEVVRVFYEALDTVTVDRVWQCRGNLLSLSGGNGAARRRDLCLSFALFRLLRLRFAEDHVGEINFPLQNDKCRDLVVKGLLSDDRDLERAFRVVEAELGFLFDFFYARYPSTLAFDLILYVLILTVSLFTLFGSVPLHYRPPAYANIVIHGFDVDVLVTRLLIILYILLESYQILALVFSDWHKVKMLCRYVFKESWHNIVVDVLLKGLWRLSVRKYWKNTISQYFLLDDLAPHPLKSFVSSMTLKTFDPWMMTSSTGLPRELKRAVLCALKASNGKITDGRMWLFDIGVLDLDLDRDCFRAHTYARYILNWHIATSICGYELSKSDDVMKKATAELKNYYDVATKLSGYCAYLVAFAPDLVPDATFTSQSLFRGTLQNAKEYLAECKSNSQKYDKLMNLGRSGATDHSVRFVSEGARIAVHLTDRMEDVEVRWKVLAEFWANLMLYIAPSDRAAAHATRLAFGGELVTIIWALLTHADVVNKLQDMDGAPGLDVLLGLPTGDGEEERCSCGDNGSTGEDAGDGTESLQEEDNVEIKIT